MLLVGRATRSWKNTGCLHRCGSCHQSCRRFDDVALSNRPLAPPWWSIFDAYRQKVFTEFLGFRFMRFIEFLIRHLRDYLSEVVTFMCNRPQHTSIRSASTLTSTTSTSASSSTPFLRGASAPNVAFPHGNPGQEKDDFSRNSPERENTGHRVRFTA